MNPSPAPLAAAVLVAAPPLAALAAWGVPRLLTLAEHPAGWLVGIAAAAVATTTLAAAAESRDDDPARTVWPMLLAWPLAFPWYMNRRGRLGSGIAGALLLSAALGWSWHRVEAAHAAEALLLNPSGEEISRQAASTSSGQASGEEITEAERMRILQRRIDAALDAEQR